MNESDSRILISDYLKNFFEDTKSDQIKEVVNQTDLGIIAVLEQLVKNDLAIKKIVNNATQKISKLETQLKQKETQLQNLKYNLSSVATINSPKTGLHSSGLTTEPLLEKLKLLKSATYNPRLFLIFNEICHRYTQTQQPVSIRRIHNFFGQTRIINSFKFSSEMKKSTVSVLIAELFQTIYIGKKLHLVPTKQAIKIFKLGLNYYSQPQITDRFTDWIKKYKLSSKICLLQAIEKRSGKINNSRKDKIYLSEQCGVHPDNISKYINQFVKLGFIVRVGSENSNNKFSMKVFESAQILNLH